MSIKGLVFDLDGVIVDTAIYHYYAWKYVAEEMGIQLNLDFNEQLKGISRADSLELILEYGNLTKNISEIEKERMLDAKNDLYLQYLEQLNKESILPGILKLLEDAKENSIPCVIASASKNAKFVIDKLNIDKYFFGIVDLSSLTKGKPDPEIFQKAVEMIGILPMESIGFEDSQAGITAIKKTGMYAVGISKNKLLENADLLLPTLQDFSLEKYLSSINEFKGNDWRK